MCEVAANFYENFFKKSNIVKPHPYTDSPLTDFENVKELIPEVTIDELIYTVQSKRKKNLLMLMIFVIICLTFLIFHTGLYYSNYIISPFNQLFYPPLGKILV